MFWSILRSNCVMVKLCDWSFCKAQSDETVGPLPWYCNPVDGSKNHSINIKNQHQTLQLCWNNPEQPPSIKSQINQIHNPVHSSKCGMAFKTDAVKYWSYGRCGVCVCVCACDPRFFDSKNWVKGRKPHRWLWTSWLCDESILNQSIDG